MSLPFDTVMPDFCSRKFPFHFATALNVLAKMGVDIDKIDMLAVGEYENYKGEVLYQEPVPGTPIHEGTKITLKIGYSSAVDFMPYQFFYGLHGGTTRSADWEDKARAMMAPFESAVMRHHATARLNILKFNLGLVDYDHFIRFLELFKFRPHDHDRQLDEALFWASLLPYFHYWAGNVDLVQKALSLLFGHEIIVKENVAATFSTPEEIRYHLGSKAGRLGREAVLGKTFTESDSSYDVIIKGIKAGDVPAFLPGGAMRLKMEWVLNICMPPGLQYRIRLVITEKAGYLGRDRKVGYLGYATNI